MWFSVDTRMVDPSSRRCQGSKIVPRMWYPERFLESFRSTEHACVRCKVVGLPETKKMVSNDH
jgi:hypothetical protein